ncbi:tRNA preQ1(34) S-adenosylmethionine ribosyltransferase-isomerase QueA [Candidatus Omnitrophota bacterium]
MRLSDFDYFLPKELIAQYPSEKRDDSRLLVLHKDTGRIEHRIFKDIVDYFHKDDLLVLNNTKVMPARLIGKKETGGKVEVLILKAGDECEALVKPARGCKVGSKLSFEDGGLKGEVVRIENGRRFLRFECNGNLEGLLDRFGKMPLPPYIKREPVDFDKKRYQTVYAEKKGAVAAPTAGLHFTKEMLSRISKKRVDVEYLTLHVGYGTFKPVKCEDVREHRMEKEYFEVRPGMVQKLKRVEGKVIAVGTTTTRTLEAMSFMQGEALHAGWTDLFIYPGYRFKAVQSLLTNFHLPKTTLLMLVSAFCGKELLFKAYKEAVKERYRFYSYGDAMLIL